jgi:hypothetical protein
MKLDDRFRSLDRTSIPEVWTEATSRATHQDDRFADLIETRRRRIPRVVAAVLVVALFLWGFIGLERSLKTGSQTSGFAPGQIARYPVPDAQPLVYGGGWIWVSGSGGGSTEIYRIDAATGITTPLPETRGAVWVAFGAGYAWALCGVDMDSPCTDPIVMKIDPFTGKVIDRIPMPGAGLFSVVTGFGSVWVATPDGILRIDPATDQITQTFTEIKPVAHVDVGGGLVWGSSLGGRIVGLDPASGAVVTSVSFADPCMVTAGSEGVYVASCGGPPFRQGQGSDQLMRIDPATGHVDYTVPLPTNATGFIILFDGLLWVGAWENDHAELIPLDPASGSPTGDNVQLPVSTQGFGVSGFGPPGLFLAGGADSLWVTHVDANDVIRIGVAGAPTPSSIDASPSAVHPAEFSFEEAAALLAEREMFVKPIPSDQQQGLLDQDAFDRILQEWMVHHPHWRVLSVHLGELDFMNGHFNISNRPSYFVEITGPETGNCFYFYDATDGQEFLGACFYPARS